MALPRLGLRNAARKHIASTEEPERQIEYRLDDEGLHIKTPRSTSSIAYSAIHRVVEGRTEFLVYTGSQIAQIIPKRAFDEPNVASARSWLFERVTPRSKSRSLQKLLILWVLLIIGLLFIWQALGPAKPH
jgi:predicted transcriptional regulator